ncbi:MAG: hypothetical protein MJ117_00390 [Lachnospiraceae bacterium]|nr:hypothetical protein [Lachnospiraceae bacterium]
MNVVSVIAGFIFGTVFGTFIMAFMVGCHGDNFDDGFSCAGCKNIHTPCGENPCNTCRRDMPDCWEE